MATNMDRSKIRLSLDVSPELNQLLDTLAERTHESKSDVLRKAIVLMDVAVKASQDGKRLLIEGPSPQPGAHHTTEIVGLFPPKPQEPRVTSVTPESYGSLEHRDTSGQ